MTLLLCLLLAQQRWFEVQIAGKPAGSLHEVVSRQGADFETAAESQMSIAREDAKLDLRARTRVLEGPDGVVKSVHVESQMSAELTVTDVQIEGRVAKIRERSGTGAIHERTLALQADLLGPEAIRRQRQTDFWTWVPDLGMPLHATRAHGEERYDGVPLARKLWLREDGELLRSEMESPLGTIAIVRVESEPTAAAAVLPKELFEQTLRRSNVRLPSPRSLQRMVARFSLDGDLESDSQRIVGGLLEVRRLPPPSQPPDLDAPAEFLDANLLIDSDDPQVKQIAAQVPGEGWERALALTRWTTRNLKFDLGIAFAPASELAKNRRGTCVGYATLLASLLRAARIPSRIVFGYVYTAGMFGGHAWVEARFGGMWIPLDAALPSDGPADAARIAAAHDSLRDGPGRALIRLQQAFAAKSLAIVEYGGAVAGDAPYLVDEREYRNPGLGFSLVAPAGLKFEKLDRVWPDRTLLSLKGPQGSIDLLEDESQSPREALGRSCRQGVVAGRPGCIAKDALAFSDGSSVFVLRARGARPRELLRAAAESFRWR